MRTEVGLLAIALLFGTGCSPNPSDPSNTTPDYDTSRGDESRIGDTEGMRPGAAQGDATGNGTSGAQSPSSADPSASGGSNSPSSDPATSR